MPVSNSEICADRSWLGPLDEIHPLCDQMDLETPAPTANGTDGASSSKRFASSYQAEILRYLDNLPGASLEDQRLGVVRAIWAAMGASSGQHLGSCGSSLSALESDGRVVASYGHRSLDGKLCRVKVSVLAEPPMGVTTPLMSPCEVSPATRGGYANSERVECDQKQPLERDAELMAHIAHLSEEIMLWSDMASELEANLIDAKQRQSDEASFVTALDAVCSDIARKDVLIRWRNRQVQHRSIAISALTQQLSEVRRDHESVKAEYGTLKSTHATSIQEREKQDKRLARLNSVNQQLQSEVTNLKLELNDTKAALDRTQIRMFLSVAETLANGLGACDPKTLVNKTLTTLVMAKDPFVSSGATKHPFHPIISRSSHHGVSGFDWDFPDLPRQSIYDQPVVTYGPPGLLH